MCQNDSAHAYAEITAKWWSNGGQAQNGYVIAWKTLWSCNSVVTSDVYSDYRWAPGWNAPRRTNVSGRKDWSRDAAGIHAFVDKQHSSDVPILVQRDEILHYGTDNTGRLTVLVTRAYLPAPAYTAALEGRTITPKACWRAAKADGLLAAGPADPDGINYGKGPLTPRPTRKPRTKPKGKTKKRTK